MDGREEYEIEKGKYVIIRSEMTSASYFVDKLETHSTVISEFFPKIFEAHPDFTYFLLVRSAGQKEYLERSLKDVYGDKFQALLDSIYSMEKSWSKNMIGFTRYLTFDRCGKIIKEILKEILCCGIRDMNNRFFDKSRKCIKIRMRLID